MRLYLLELPRFDDYNDFSKEHSWPWRVSKQASQAAVWLTGFCCSGRVSGLCL